MAPVTTVRIDYTSCCMLREYRFLLSFFVLFFFFFIYIISFKTSRWHWNIAYKHTVRRRFPIIYLSNKTHTHTHCPIDVNIEKQTHIILTYIITMMVIIIYNTASRVHRWRKVTRELVKSRRKSVCEKCAQKIIENTHQKICTYI